eukprot:TRINITY_DN10843_c0_g5_i1.p1 TRINITY_DN10843_c0_g5~~TRINITY_DN10843_c0_g5_i1.p1  ORF type:complete len:241 (+),score=21.01 TRINITY_DN10843_c0_g5_i1:24-725(+)
MGKSAEPHAAGSPRCAKSSSLHMELNDCQTSSTQDMSSGCNSCKSFSSHEDDVEESTCLKRLGMMAPDAVVPVEDECVQELSYISSCTVAKGLTCSKDPSKELTFCGRRDLFSEVKARDNAGTLTPSRECKQRKPVHAFVRGLPSMVYKVLEAIESADAEGEASKDSGTHGPPRSRRLAYDLGYDEDKITRRALVVPPCGRYKRSTLQRGNRGDLLSDCITGSDRQFSVRYSL